MPIASPDADAPTLWLVDDDPHLLGFLQDVFVAAGYTTTGFADPRAFLAHAAQQDDRRRRVVLCDLAMPGLDGFGVAAALRALGYTDPVILMSAQIDPTQAVRAIREGFHDVVEKPLDIDALLDGVAAALQDGGGTPDAPGLAARLATLTTRESEVLAALGCGLLEEQAAMHLGLSIATLAGYRRNLIEKLGLPSAAALLRLAVALRPGHMQR